MTLNVRISETGQSVGVLDNKFLILTLLG
jgi:hypothetical protein